MYSDGGLSRRAYGVLFPNEVFAKRPLTIARADYTFSYYADENAILLWYVRKIYVYIYIYVYNKYDDRVKGKHSRPSLISTLPSKGLTTIGCANPRDFNSTIIRTQQQCYVVSTIIETWQQCTGRRRCLKTFGPIHASKYANWKYWLITTTKGPRRLIKGEKISDDPNYPHGVV